MKRNGKMNDRTMKRLGMYLFHVIFGGCFLVPALYYIAGKDGK